jgi:hypothetical protein
LIPRPRGLDAALAAFAYPLEFVQLGAQVLGSRVGWRKGYEGGEEPKQ